MSINVFRQTSGALLPNKTSPRAPVVVIAWLSAMRLRITRGADRTKGHRLVVRPQVLDGLIFGG
jgi:hypothetical protein